MPKNRRKYNYKILFLSYGIVVEDRPATPPISATASLSTPNKRKQERAVLLLLASLGVYLVRNKRVDY